MRPVLANGGKQDEIDVVALSGTVGRVAFVRFVDEELGEGVRG